MKTRKMIQLNPPSTIGIIGGGQLGRMTAQEAKRMGYNVVIFDPKPNSPAGQVADKQIIADYSDLAALKELAHISDVMTYEFEHINVEALSALEREGHRIYPSSNTLRLIQNKYIQKTMLVNNGIKTPVFYLVNNFEELKKLFEKMGKKAILKTCREGYDGKGNIIINDIAELKHAYQKLSGSEMMIEEFLDFTKEVSIIVARNSNGIALYPISENVHQNSILIKSIVPAAVSREIEEKIRKLSINIVEVLDDYGVFCIEFFIDSDCNVFVNEIAPRPHNSGHYTIEGCVSSQFEQLVRIVCGLPLGSAQLRMPCAMYNILGSQSITGRYSIGGVDSILNIPDCHFHLYGKAESSHLKKIGHITVLDESVETADHKAEQAVNKIEVIIKG